MAAGLWRYIAGSSTDFYGKISELPALVSPRTRQLHHRSGRSKSETEHLAEGYAAHPHFDSFWYLSSTDNSLCVPVLFSKSCRSILGRSDLFYNWNTYTIHTLRIVQKYFDFFLRHTKTPPARRLSGVQFCPIVNCSGLDGIYRMIPVYSLRSRCQADFRVFFAAINLGSER